jgi:sodium-dependent dicarboxylate transporter 2/3/5
MKLLLPLIGAFIAFFVSSLFLDIHQSFLIAVIILLVAYWSNEALPLGVVSLLPIILFPVLGISDLKSVSVNYANPIIFLFLGGFMLAIAVEKTALHKVIANKILAFFPNTTRGIVFALLITSAVLSSILSNTTTALLLMPIAMFLTNDFKLKTRFILAIAYGASIGGIITPIGTPPNLILLGFLEENSINNYTFIEWMLKTVPLAVFMLLIVGFILSLNIKDFKIDLKVDTKLGDKQKKLKNILLILIFFLFINSFVKAPDAIILLSFGLLMFLPKIGFLEWEDTKKIPYEIIFLFGAGFSIAKGFHITHLDSVISEFLLNITHFHSFILIVLIAFTITFTTEITSNTALISIILPIIYSIGENSNINTGQLLMIATISASYAFMLPIATPPNAIAFSAGIKIKDMAKFGILFNLIAITITSLIGYFYW